MKQTLTDWTRWITAVKGQSERTARTYAGALNAMQNDLPVPLAEASKEQLRDWAADTASRLSPATVNLRINAMRSWASFAGVELEFPPIRSIPHRMPATISHADFELLRATAMRTCRAPMIPLALEWLYYTGIRASELCGVRLGDLNLDDGTCLIRGKGRKERLVPIGRLVPETKVALVGDRERLRKIAGGENTADSHLFLNRSGNPLKYSALYGVLDRAAKEAGVACHPHKLRATFATEMSANAGAGDMELANMLGHSSIETTRRYVAASAQRMNSLSGARD